MAISQRLRLSFHNSSWSSFLRIFTTILWMRKEQTSFPFYRYDRKMGGGREWFALFSRKDCRSWKRQEQFVFRESQGHSHRQEEPGRRKRQNCDPVSRSPWGTKLYYLDGGMCFFLFLPHLPWYQNKSQSEEDGIPKQYILVISGEK